MSLLTVGFFLLLCGAYAASEENPSPKENYQFTEEASKQIIKLLWGIFGSNLIAQSSVYTNGIGPVEAVTPMGKVKGIETHTSREGKHFGAFLGMPYAKPPIGELRFQAPVPAEPWTGTWDATYERPSCFQFMGTENESEDCLYINVYTPNYRSGGSLLPVMVFVYGGAFMTGSSNSSVYAPDFLVEHDVILVTFNYRIGPLGFMSMQNEKIPGNAGLKDQILALKWVRDNIESLGGDPDEITLFGESAGAASINYHLLSDSSKGYFRRAIMESGTATCPWAYTPPDVAAKTARRLAKKLGCAQPKSTDDEIVQCLRTVSARELTDTQESTLSLEDLFAIRPFSYTPTAEPDIEGAFITESPIDLMYSNRSHGVPTIIGSNSREGLLILPALKQFDPIGLLSSLIGLNLSFFFPSYVRQELPWNVLLGIHYQIRRFYFGFLPVNYFTRDRLINLISDAAFIVPVQQTAALLSEASEEPVYNYRFSYEGSYGFHKSSNGIAEEKGVCHGDELGYIFYSEEYHPDGEEARDEKYAEDEKMVRFVTTLWTNFAKTGNPTPRPEKDGEVSFEWEPFKANQYKYLEIDSDMRMKEVLSGKAMNFWYNLVMKTQKT